MTFFVCVLNFHRKIMAANNMDMPSWKNISPTTPQHCDWQSCGVYVIKVSSNTNCFSVSKRESNSEHSFDWFLLVGG